jgi:hypothetical protein
MIILLKEVRSSRLQALRALRLLDHWAAEDEEEELGGHGPPFKPGLKEALDMVNALPIRIRIWPDHLPKFEEDFHVQVLSDSPPGYECGGCKCAPDAFVAGPMPWAAIHFPGGVFAIGGSVRDLADTIHRLLGDGHPEDRITIELLGGGPVRWPVPMA